MSTRDNSFFFGAKDNNENNLNNSKLNECKIKQNKITSIIHLFLKLFSFFNNI
jgi:hypothetical protein